MEREINPEIAYILGALRDATADVRKGKNYEIKIAQKETSWIQFLQKLFERNFGVSGNITSHVNGTQILRINGKEFVNEILEISEMKIPQEHWNTPSIMKKQPLEIQKYYIRGFFDAEGGLPKDPKNAKQKYLSFSQKNMDSLKFVREVLMRIGLNPTNITFCGNVWEFRLTRKREFPIFYKTINSWHKDRKSRLEVLCNGITFP